MSNLLQEVGDANLQKSTREPSENPFIGQNINMNGYTKQSSKTSRCEFKPTFIETLQDNTRRYLNMKPQEAVSGFFKTLRQGVDYLSKEPNSSLIVNLVNSLPKQIPTKDENGNYVLLNSDGSKGNSISYTDYKNKENPFYNKPLHFTTIEDEKEVVNFSVNFSLSEVNQNIIPLLSAMLGNGSTIPSKIGGLDMITLFYNEEKTKESDYKQSKYITRQGQEIIQFRLKAVVKNFKTGEYKLTDSGSKSKTVKPAFYPFNFDWFNNEPEWTEFQVSLAEDVESGKKFTTVSNSVKTAYTKILVNNLVPASAIHFNQVVLPSHGVELVPNGTDKDGNVKMKYQKIGSLKEVPQTTNPSMDEDFSDNSDKHVPVMDVEANVSTEESVAETTAEDLPF